MLEFKPELMKYGTNIEKNKLYVGIEGDKFLYTFMLSNHEIKEGIITKEMFIEHLSEHIFHQLSQNFTIENLKLHFLKISEIVLAKNPIIKYSGQLTLFLWLNTEKFGHAALQTCKFNEEYGVSENGVYISIYPSGRGLTLWNRTGVKFKVKTLEQDMKKYGNITPIKFIFENVELSIIKNIEQEYELLIEKSFNFAFTGSSFFKKSETYNCSGIIAYLLNKHILNPIYHKKFEYFLSEEKTTNFFTKLSYLSPIVTFFTGALVGAKVVADEAFEQVGHYKSLPEYIQLSPSNQHRIANFAAKKQGRIRWAQNNFTDTKLFPQALHRIKDIANNTINLLFNFKINNPFLILLAIIGIFSLTSYSFSRSAGFFLGRAKISPNDIYTVLTKIQLLENNNQKQEVKRIHLRGSV